MKRVFFSKLVLSESELLYHQKEKRLSRALNQAWTHLQASNAHAKPGGLENRNCLL